MTRFFTRGAVQVRAGRCRHRPLRKRNKRCNRRATARVAPTKALQGGQGRAESPGHGFAVPAPFRQGGLGDGGGGCSCCGAQNFHAALRRTLEILTAATRSLRSLCHRQRSVRSPHRPAVPATKLSVGGGVPDAPATVLFLTRRGGRLCPPADSIPSLLQKQCHCEGAPRPWQSVPPSPRPPCLIRRCGVLPRRNFPPAPHCKSPAKGVYCPHQHQAE